MGNQENKYTIFVGIKGSGMLLALVLQKGYKVQDQT